MIAINKEEKELLHSKYPDLHIVRTVKQKSKRHHYFCEETPQVKRFLSRLYQNNVNAIS